MVLRRLTGMMLALSIPIVFVGCDSADDGPTDPNTDTTQKIEIISGQTPDNGMLRISKVTSTKSGWVVIHRSAANQPVTVANIGKTHVDAGTSTDVMIRLDSGVVNGEALWAVLYEDTGIQGQFEYTGSGSPDQPVMVNNAGVRTPFSVQQTDPLVIAEDQTPSNAEIVIKQVSASENGWIVVHASNSSDAPGQIIGRTHVNAGTNMNVIVPLDISPENTIRTGDILWAKLHYDRGAENTFEYPGADEPVIFDGEGIIRSFVITAADEPNVVIENQTVTDNIVTVALATTQEVGWVSVYDNNEEDNGPDLSKPRGHSRITLGVNTGVKVHINGLAAPYGTKLWVVMHYDRGTIGTYEYPGSDSIVYEGLLNPRMVMDSFIVQ